MKKIISISIAILFLFQSSQICHEDFLKADALLEDIAFHKKAYGDTIFVFFSKHYGNLKDSHQEQHKKEEKEHQHPPLSGDCHIHTQLVVIYQFQIPYLNTLCHKIEAIQNFYYQDLFSTFEKKSIFQPPKKFSNLI